MFEDIKMVIKSHTKDRQKPYKRQTKRQTKQWLNRKRTNDDVQNIAQKTKDRATGTLLKGVTSAVSWSEQIVLTNF
jgi:hypothetical protein